MPTKVFVSYSHKQGPWVADYLVPVLRAGGVEVLWDDDFRVGRSIVGQMDATQAQADRHLLVFSPDYLASPMCQHEMNRAIAQDPSFSNDVVIPIQREKVVLPSTIRAPNPLYMTLGEAREKDAEAWSKVLSACGADESAWSVPQWLEARQKVRRFLARKQSVSLVVAGRVPWRALLDNLEDLAQVDLDSGVTMTRRGLVDRIFQSLGSQQRAKGERTALAVLQRHLEAMASPPTLGLLHFDRTGRRFDGDFFGALRHVIDKRLLVVLFQSRQPFASIVPADDPLSDIDLKTVNLGSHHR